MTTNRQMRVLSGWQPLDETVFPRLRSRARDDVCRLGPASRYSPAVLALTEHLSLSASIRIVRPYHVFDTPIRPELTWGVKLEVVLEHACANLARITRGAWTCLEPGLYESPWRDGLDASRLCLIDAVRALPVSGDPVALPVTQSRVLVAGAEDPRALAAMVRALYPGLGDAQPRLTLIPMRLCGRRWRTWWPDVERHGSDVAAMFGRLRAVELADDYQLQQVPLQQRHPHAFVSPLRVEGSPQRTLAFLPRGKVALLPEADRVVLAEPVLPIAQRGTEPAPDPSRCLLTIAATSFAKLRLFMGDRMRRIEIWPPRWQVDGFPSACQLRAMAAPDALEQGFCA